jgi:hypothetical protein
MHWTLDFSGEWAKAGRVMEAARQAARPARMPRRLSAQPRAQRPPGRTWCWKTPIQGALGVPNRAPVALGAWRGEIPAP